MLQIVLSIRPISSTNKRKVKKSHFSVAFFLKQKQQTVNSKITKATKPIDPPATRVERMVLDIKVKVPFSSVITDIEGPSRGLFLKQSMALSKRVLLQTALSSERLRLWIAVKTRLEKRWLVARRTEKVTPTKMMEAKDR